MTSRCASFSLLFLLLAAPATAQVSAGVRAGTSIDPDQFYFGGQLETRPLADHVHFRPNVEVGIGHDVTVIAFNFELAYKFPTRLAWQPYVAAGPALNIVNQDADSRPLGGFNVAFGLEHRGGLFGEVKVGAMDSPGFKVGLGFRF